MSQQPGASGSPSTTHDRPSITFDDEANRRRAREEHAHAMRDEQPLRVERRVSLPAVSRIRGGPVWGGFTVALATWILLELALFAVDLGGLAARVVPEADTSAWWWSGAAACIAFFVGGLVAGASSVWDRVSDGVLQGLVVWSLIVVALLVLSAVGAGIGFGVVGDVLATSPDVISSEASPTVVADAQSAAAAAVLALGITLAASALGGAIGAKLWPRDADLISVP
jgi:hypothetical protein